MTVVRVVNPLAEVRDPTESIGASGAVITMRELEPMCTHTTVPTSSHAAKNGSQWPEWMLGWFDDMIVNGNQYQIFDIHCIPPIAWHEPHTCVSLPTD